MLPPRDESAAALPPARDGSTDGQGSAPARVGAGSGNLTESGDEEDRPERVSLAAGIVALRGRVIGPEGRSVADAEVILKVPGKEAARIEVDPGGRFATEGASPGPSAPEGRDLRRTPVPVGGPHPRAEPDRRGRAHRRPPGTRSRGASCGGTATGNRFPCPGPG